MARLRQRPQQISPPSYPIATPIISTPLVTARGLRLSPSSFTLRSIPSIHQIRWNCLETSHRAGYGLKLAPLTFSFSYVYSSIRSVHWPWASKQQHVDIHLLLLCLLHVGPHFNLPRDHRCTKAVGWLLVVIVYLIIATRTPLAVVAVSTWPCLSLCLYPLVSLFLTRFLYP